MITVQTVNHSTHRVGKDKRVRQGEIKEIRVKQRNE